MQTRDGQNSPATLRSISWVQQGTRLIQGLDPVEIADDLDRLYCYEQVAIHVVRAIENRLTGHASITSRTLVDHSAELPRINYGQYNTKPYKYVYANGIDKRGESVFLDTIVKFDVESGGVKQWRYDNHFPGEPVFVTRPDASAEDDGVLLTVVLDASTNTSYLLVLDARDLSEIARAHVPQHVPFGFHGAYLRR